MLRIFSPVQNSPHQPLLAEALSQLHPLQPEGVCAVLVDHHGQQIETVGSLHNLEALCALCNGLMSVSDSLVRQVSEPWADYVVVNSVERQIVILPATHSGVAALVVVAPRQMRLDPLLWAARQCCAKLSGAIETKQTDLPTVSLGLSAGG